MALNGANITVDQVSHATWEDFQKSALDPQPPAAKVPVKTFF